MNVLNTSLWAGAQCTLIPKFDNRKIWDLLLDEEDGMDHTIFMAVPTIYRYLVEHYENNGLEEQAKEVKRKLKSFRLMVSGSAPLAEGAMARWKEITDHTLLERYGMTEIGMGLTNPYSDKDKRLPGHVGHPFPNVTAALLDADTNQIHNELGKEGELLIQSPCMFDRYLDNPEATEETFVTLGDQKWFKTGDMAVQPEESEGAYKIMGRIS